MDATIIVATYGSMQRQGDETADIASMFDLPIVRIHSTNSTLAQVRNAGAALSDSQWLCFLDAEDGLGPKYFEEMKVLEQNNALLTPRLLFVESTGIVEPFDLTIRDMAHGNPCPIGTLIEKDVFDSVGGFWEEPAYEDWSLFRRAWLKGAKVIHTDAKYYASPSRRNNVENPAELINSIKESHDQWL